MKLLAFHQIAEKTIEVLLNWQEAFMQLVEQSTNEPRFKSSKLATAGNPEKIAEKAKKLHCTGKL